MPTRYGSLGTYPIGVLPIGTLGFEATGPSTLEASAGFLVQPMKLSYDIAYLGALSGSHEVSLSDLSTDTSNLGEDSIDGLGCSIDQGNGLLDMLSGLSEQISVATSIVNTQIMREQTQLGVLKAISSDFSGSTIILASSDYVSSYAMLSEAISFIYEYSLLGLSKELTSLDEMSLDSLLALQATMGPHSLGSISANEEFSASLVTSMVAQSVAVLVAQSELNAGMEFTLTGGYDISASTSLELVGSISKLGEINVSITLHFVEEGRKVRVAATEKTVLIKTTGKSIRGTHE